MRNLGPRYSLLTLLVLTALVAGGVKLWYGPHHVVERSEHAHGFDELEYSFTRDWHGNRIVDGPRIHRNHWGGEVIQVTILWFRQGLQVDDWQYHLLTVPGDEPESVPTIFKDKLGNPYITSEERAHLRKIIDLERRRQPPEGKKYEEREFLSSQNRFG